MSGSPKKKALGAFQMPTLHIKVRVTSPGGIIVHEHEEKGHSWTRNAWNAWHAMMLDAPGFGSGFGRGALSCNSYGTHNVYVEPSTAFMRWSSAILGSGFGNNTTGSDYGILVGRSDSPFYTDDYMLYDLIATGAGAGQFSYLAQEVPVVAFDGVLNKFSNTLSRVMNNNSGASITVRELGLVFYGTGNATTALMARDVLDIPVAVINGAQLTVSYTITTGSFDECDAGGLPALPAIGTPGSGGYYMGSCSQWPEPLHLWMLICSSTDGEATDKKWKTSSDDPPGAESSDLTYGFPNMAGIYAIGAASEIGAYCAAKNAALLGGYGDWYIPSYYEASPLYDNRASLPGGDAFSDSAYWLSTRYDGVNAYYCNLFTGSIGGAAKANGFYVRLVRRVHREDWLAG